MNYSFVAGALVTLSFFLLFIENNVSSYSGDIGKLFLVLYSLGVVFWLCLGVLMNQIGLVIISTLQLFFIAMYTTTSKNQKQ